MAEPRPDLDAGGGTRLELQGDLGPTFFSCDGFRMFKASVQGQGGTATFNDDVLSFDVAREAVTGLGFDGDSLFEKAVFARGVFNADAFLAIARFGFIHGDDAPGMIAAEVPPTLAIFKGRVREEIDFLRGRRLPKDGGGKTGGQGANEEAGSGVHDGAKG